MKNASVYSRYLPALLSGIFVAIGLYLSSLYNYLLFHTIAELASIAVAYGLFMIAWNSREFNENRYVVFLGVAYLFIGSLDFVHTLAYKGMPIFSGYDANLPTQLWIAARYLESLSLLFALIFLQRRLKSEHVFSVYSVTFVILLLAVLTDTFPTCYREGLGLTQFKIVSEYIISCTLLAGLGLLYFKRAVFAPPLFKLMTASILCTICSELAFTFYVSVYGLSNLVGHYFKLLSFYLIYKAVIETGLREPYAVLFRNLQESRAMLREREERFRRLAENAPEIIFRYNLRPEPHFDYVSSAATAIIGYTPDEHYADPQLGLKLIAPDDRERFEHYMTRLLERQIRLPEMIELRWIHKNGRLIWTEQHITPVHDAAGNLIALEGIARDVTDRKQAEQTLQESEERYRRLVELSPDLIAIHQDGVFVFINAAGARFLGAAGPDQIIGKAVIEFVVPDRKDLFVARVRQLLAQDASSPVYEQRVRRLDGAEATIEVVGIPFPYKGAPAVQIIARDISDRKQAEEALRESEQRLRLALAGSGVSFWEWFPEEGIIGFDPRWAEILGYEPGEKDFNFKWWEEAIHPDSRPVFEKALNDYLAGQKPRYELEYQIQTKTGEWKWVWAAGECVEYTPEGKPKRFLGTHRDITDCKQVEAMLRQNEARFRLIAETSAEDIWQLDLNGQVTYVSPAVERLFGYTPEEAVKIDFASFFPESERDRAAAAFVKAASGQEYQLLEFTGKRKDGAPIPIEVSVTPIVKDNCIIGVQGIARDITDRKQTEAQLRISLEKYRVLFEAFPIGISVTDSQGKIVEANRESERLLGISAQEHTYRKFDGPEWRILRPDGSPMPSDEYASVRALKEQCLIENVEMGIVKGEGEVTWINVHAIPIPLEGYGVLITYHDITDRKHAAGALRENEERYRKAQKLGRVGNWEYNLQTTEFWGSEEAKRTYGFDPGSTSFSTEEVERCIPERERVHQALVDLIEKDQEYNLEFDILTHDTQERKTIVSLAELERDTQGRPLKVTGVIQDITERKQIEKSLDREKALLKVIIDNIPIMITRYDPNTKMLYLNKEFERKIGWKAEELQDIDLMEKVYPDPIYRQKAREYMLKATAEWQEFTVRSKSGESIASEWSNLRLDDETQIGIGIDITDRKRAQKLLETERQRFFSVLELIPAFVYLQARDYSIAFANHTFRELFGDPDNRLCYAAIHGRSAPCEECRTFTVFQTKQPVTWEWTRNTGQTYMICDNLFLDTDGAEMVLEIGIDITDRKQAAEQVKAALKEKEVLLREIHHRVKNNLMVVTSLIEMQAGQTTHSEALALFRDLYNRVMAMAMIHKDLYQTDNLAQIDFGPYLERLLMNIHQSFAKTRAAIKVIAEGIFLGVEQAIPCSLIVAELATNAFKYAFPFSSRLRSMTASEGTMWGVPAIERSRDEGPELRVEMRRDDNAYTLIVSDNGAGLPPEFDWRKTDTLGLTLVRSWATHQLKGKIEVDAQQGTQFIITFQVRGL